ncbi:MAG: class I SAM-dependent methyltransferase [Gammaproteobacteria bacterium]|nr:class I SAM-dependent methyltransferase [Gammaproteobacteria bacterium]
MQHQSEKKFVEWSECITLRHHNVRCVARLLNTRNNGALKGLDVGGGVGTFASHVCTLVSGCQITVIDKSSLARDGFVANPGLRFEEADFLSMDETTRYDFIIMKTVLHHFIGEGETETRANQLAALEKARRLLKPDGLLLIEENFYEDFFGKDLIGRFILALTQPRLLEPLIRRLGANTAGEGVRFRSLHGWKDLFAESGLEIDTLEKSPTWGTDFPLWQRLPLLCKQRFQAVLSLRRVPALALQPVIERTWGKVRKTAAAIAALSTLALVIYREAEA